MLSTRNHYRAAAAMIPERYDTLIWGIIALIALTAATLTILHAINQIEPGRIYIPIPAEPTRQPPPHLET